MLSKNQLADQLALQQTMNSTVNPEWLTANYAWHRAIMVEAVEALDHFGWKWWKKSEPDVAQVQISVPRLSHFTFSAEQLDLNIRAFNPWPVAFFPISENNNLRVWNSQLSALTDTTAQVGEVVAIDKQGVHVMCGDQHIICLTQLQWPGGKPLNAAQILQAQKLQVGQILS